MHTLPFSSPKVLAFDVFGTVVDWHSGIARAVQALQPAVDGDAFALAWRAGYQPAMRRVMSGELGWTLIDDLHRLILDEILEQFGLGNLTKVEKKQLNKAWHRLDPWPDVVAGLTRLKSRHVICTLSNGNIGLLAGMAKHAGLPWDCILSAEVFRAYKPDPATYFLVLRRQPASGFQVDQDYLPADLSVVSPRLSRSCMPPRHHAFADGFKKAQHVEFDNGFYARRKFAGLDAERRAFARRHGAFRIDGVVLVLIAHDRDPAAHVHHVHRRQIGADADTQNRRRRRQGGCETGRWSLFMPQGSR